MDINSIINGMVLAILGSAGIWSFINNSIERRDRRREQKDDIKVDINNIKADIEEIKKSIGETRNAMEESLSAHFAVLARTHILRFDDSLINEPNRKISRENFNQQLEDINTYLEYCESHPNFKNECANNAIAHIRKVYQRYLDDKLFVEE